MSEVKHCKDGTSNFFCDARIDSKTGEMVLIHQLWGYIGLSVMFLAYIWGWIIKVEWKKYKEKI